MINFRVQPSTKARASKGRPPAAGRTLSAEAEFQLRRALVDMATPLPAIMSAIVHAIDGLAGRVRSPGGRNGGTTRASSTASRRWSSPRFEMLREPGPPPPESAEGPDEGWPDAPFASDAVREIEAVDATTPFAEQTPASASSSA